MTLNWTTHQHHLEAIGHRGTYTIEVSGLALHVLKGVGHDTLPMIDLPPMGAVFTHQWDARQAAETLDTRPSWEVQVSGT